MITKLIFIVVAEIVLDTEKVTVTEGDDEVRELCLTLKNSAIDVGVRVSDALLAGTYIDSYVGVVHKRGSQYEEPSACMLSEGYCSSCSAHVYLFVCFTSSSNIALSTQIIVKKHMLKWN